MRSVFGYLGTESLDVVSSKSFHEKEFHAYGQNNHKFKEDKIFLNHDKFVVVLDGVIFNKAQLLATSQENWETYFLEQWLKSPIELLNRLRGEFSGFVFCKSTKRLQVFNNPTGTKQIYYYKHKDKFAFASSALDLVKLVKRLGWTVEVSEEACYSFLAYGALLKESSWLKDSYKLKAGSILSLNGDITIEPYKIFKIKEDVSKSKSELLETFDKLITNAVRLEWEKDREYHYTSFSTLSGGLDSRVNVMLARKLGFKNQVNFCCSQKGYADETISRQMAKDFGHQYCFHPLDGLEHFYKSDYILKKIGGCSAYMGPAHLRYGIDQYWKEEYGIIHSGQLGDGLLGGFLSQDKFVKPDLSFGREPYTTIEANAKFENEIRTLYSNEEEYKMYERGFQIANSGFWVLEDLSYYSSPFMDIDVLDFLCTLPYKYKYKRTFYLEWMMKYHPEMTTYKWEYIHSKPNAVWKTKYATTFMRIKYGWKKLLNPEFRLKFDMSPEQYWYNTSEKIQTFYKNAIDEKWEHLKSKTIPYKSELKQFGQSRQANQLSKALSMLIVLDEIYRKDD